MDPKRWSRPIYFQASRYGEFRTVTNTSEAATALNTAWPISRGRSLKTAKRTCQQVLSGKRAPSEARNAFIAAAVEINDPGHPARLHARDYKLAFAARLVETAREAGATNPEQLGEQLALLLDGASARNRVLNAETFATAAAIAAVLIDKAIPAAAPTCGVGEN